MFGVDRLILLAAVLLMLGIASSKLSSRMGLPVLVLFLVVGMLAGEDGIGGIVFDNYVLAHGVGTVALAMILFDGGLRTDLRQFRSVMAPALTLASVGVVMTAAIVGLSSMWLLDLPWIVAFLGPASSPRPTRRPFSPYSDHAGCGSSSGWLPCSRSRAHPTTRWPSS